MKNGLYEENGLLIYYENDIPVKKGVFKDKTGIYYIDDNGIAIKGKKYIHSYMTNGILKRGTYEFGDDYKKVKGFYIKPSNSSHHRKHKKIKYKKTLIASCFVMSMLLIALIIILCVKPPATSDDNYDPEINNPETVVPTSKIEINLPKYENEVYLLNDNVKKIYTDGKTIESIKNSVKDPYKPFEFNYKISLTTIADYTLEEVTTSFKLSEDQGFANYKEYTLDLTKNSLQIDNLKVNSTYYYTLDITTPDKTYNYSGNFKTANTTRFLNIPNLLNVRDIGGYENSDGQVVKQGMIIRGSEIDGLVEPEYFLDREYIDYVEEEFGFKFDMDLRVGTLFEYEYKSMLGENVIHKFYDAPAYGYIYVLMYKETLKNIFADLANPNNYPMYLHCTYGLDRTGTVIFLLGGILGLSEEDLIYEYELSSFAHKVTAVSRLNPIMGGLEGYNGETINEKIVDFLVNEIGVTPEQIESIRNILLD